MKDAGEDGRADASGLGVEGREGVLAAVEGVAGEGEAEGEGDEMGGLDCVHGFLEDGPFWWGEDGEGGVRQMVY